MYSEFIEYMNWTSMTVVWLRVICGVAVIYLFSTNRISNSKNTYNFVFGFLILYIVVRLGLTPSCLTIPSDRGNYSHWFLEQKNASSFFNSTGKDFGLPFINYVLGKFVDINTYFVIIAALYVGNYCYGTYRMAGRKSYWLFLAISISFGFTSYGVNTMRAGLGISFIVIALSYWKSLKTMLGFLTIGIIFHFSMVIPSLMIIIAHHYNRTRLFYYLWFLSIPLSFVAGSVFNSVFATFSSDSRTSYLTTTETAYNVGFRLNFIIYSLAPLAVGAYYIFKRGFNDKFYQLLYNSYILTNIFWILVIRANYSDRFAYLSWFMIPFVLVYPLLKDNCPVKNSSTWLGCILLGEILFSFV